ncbi:uncharacterized protein ACHE_20298S [Aspergillus chevalieri]|uniref:NADH:flavin oxidoreductase/NADH oxidase N-terminal domain-containing protein n=1 Tax=Aspergillus chevalieri TaxID=182096 RepID=A0A7R7VHJ2_ASPCH|nr:uncharacterized protein ACHE_20298S [Aspergillus chevalieri]BCR84840.1 hypothetical protein ACHE_20298S [Aspergillus chevalieri]
MAEGLADKGHLPGTRISRVYGEWAKGGWGALLTDERQSLELWKKYADTCQQHGTPAIAQICHPGRQSPRGAGERGLFGKAIAPSEVPLHIGNGLAPTIVRNIVFGMPKAMSHADIDHVIAQFVNCARVLAQCGFGGIEIHAAHGYLLSQFLSSRSNIRQDDYGGDAERRARIVLEIIHQIRKAVPAAFCVGIKLNSADHNASSFEDTMTQIQLFSDAGVDFLEISGGTYEDPTMMGRGLRGGTSNTKSQNPESGEAFFLDFATQARKRFPNLILLLTGGFRTRKGIEAALKDGVCDLVGIGRPAVLRPDFPRFIMDDIYSDQEARVVFPKVPIPFLARLLQIRMLGGGAETQYFRGQIHRIAAGLVAYAP